MTTNKPSALNKALIRPGRVDLQVSFTNATRSQVKELFIRMHMADSKPMTSNAPAPGRHNHPKISSICTSYVLPQDSQLYNQKHIAPQTPS